MKRGGLLSCVAAFAVVLAVVALMAVGSCSKTEKAPSTIKIGILLDLTGPIGPGGLDLQKGVNLALEKVGGVVAGKKIEYVTEDAASDASVSVDKSKKLVETDKVALILGPINGGGGVSVAQYAEKVHVPQFAPLSATNDAAFHDWAFCPGGVNLQAGFGPGVYAHDVLGYKTAVTLAADFVPGHDYTASFKTGFEGAGGKVIQETYYPEGTTNLTPYLTALKKADVFVFWGTPGDCFAAIPQYREINIKMPIMQAEDGGVTSSPGMLKNLGKAAAGIVFGTAYLYTADTPGNKEFVDAYQKKYNELPGVMSGAGYADMQLIFAALTASGGNVDHDALYKAIKGVSVDTVRGHLTFPADQGGFGLIANYPVLMGKIGENLGVERIVPPFVDVRVKVENNKISPYVAK